MRLKYLLLRAAAGAAAGTAATVAAHRVLKSKWATYKLKPTELRNQCDALHGAIKRLREKF